MQKTADGYVVSDVGEGTNEITLTPSKTSATPGFLNASHQQLILDTVSTPYSLYLEGDDDFARMFAFFLPETLHIGMGGLMWLIPWWEVKWQFLYGMVFQQHHGIDASE